MMWEYMVVYQKIPMGFEMDRDGAKGWELVSVIKDGYDWALFYKRIKNSS